MSDYAAVKEAFRIADTKNGTLQKALLQRQEKDANKFSTLKSDASSSPLATEEAK